MKIFLIVYLTRSKDEENMTKHEEQIRVRIAKKGIYAEDINTKVG